METVTFQSGGFFFAMLSGEARGVGDAAPYGCIIDGAVGRGSLAHRCADRLTGTVVPANRGTSSKPARFIRHWRRFADFHVRQKKRLSARKRARLRRVRCRGLQSPSKKRLCRFF